MFFAGGNITSSTSRSFISLQERRQGPQVTYHNTIKEVIKLDVCWSKHMCVCVCVCVCMHSSIKTQQCIAYIYHNIRKNSLLQNLGLLDIPMFYILHYIKPS